MSEMVERVARAIADAFMEDYDEAPNLYDALAEAAIGAMREPTATMFMRAGNTPISNLGRDGSGRKGRIGDDAARDAWITMIDAALSPSPTPAVLATGGRV